MGHTKIYNVDRIHSLITDTTRPARKHCNADAFIKALQKCFLAVPDARQAHKVSYVAHKSHFLQLNLYPMH